MVATAVAARRFRRTEQVRTAIVERPAALAGRQLMEELCGLEALGVVGRRRREGDATCE